MVNNLMSTTLSRRSFLASATIFGAASFIGRPLALAAGKARRLTAGRRTIEVNGRAASVFDLRAEDGRSGLVIEPGERFSPALDNQTGEPTIVHWHGQTPPAVEDGVTQTGYAGPLAPGESRTYDFEPRPGTHWMHSHHGLQEQALLAAPLIVRTEADRAADREEVTILLHDFTFRDPADVLASLSGGMGMGIGGTGGMGRGRGGGMGGMGGMMSGAGMNPNEFDHDAYLANDRTLDDPQVVRIEPNGQVLVRLINGAAATAFWIDLGDTVATLVAVDGNAVVPVSSSYFPIAPAQRLDLTLTVPAGETVALLAQRQGDRARTGVVLAAKGATIAKIAAVAELPVAPVDLSLEAQLTAVEPLPTRPADVVHRIVLSGGMMGYVWSIDGLTWDERRPLTVRHGQRVVIEMTNHSMMVHPMHLHGHHFQVIGLNGRGFSGATRDTVMVPPMGSIAIAFDADNPGRWLFHCHNLYHMAAGMMTEVVYTDMV
jgi:FtsP/CotA-like multicopper oxidase with cupredoxin domain